MYRYPPRTHATDLFMNFRLCSLPFITLLVLRIVPSQAAEPTADDVRYFETPVIRHAIV